MPEQQAMVSEQDQIIVELTNRLRVLESKQSLFSERLLIVNQNMLEEYKRLMKEIKAIDLDIKELNKDINNLKNILKHLTEEASTFAKKDSLKVLEKYINLWNPLHFVTEKDVENILRRLLEENARPNQRSNADDAARTGEAGNKQQPGQKRLFNPTGK
jgi:hypothetical protein